MPSAVSSLNIHDGQQMVLVTTLRHQWNLNNKSSSVRLLENNLKVLKKLEEGTSYDYCFGEFHLNKKRNYFEVKIDWVDFKENILIGVANENTDLSKNPLQTGQFWGLQPLMYT
jgi:hypothetical protein